MKKVVIVESPSKAKTISKYLDSSFIVLASSGHIVDLPEGSIGVDIENQFKPEWVVLKGKKKIIEQIKKTCSLSGRVYLATDPDREGEAIAHHLQNFCKIKNPIRIRLKEITEDEILSKIQSNGKIDDRLVEAQIARRILDRIAGYTWSPVLWKYGKNLSAGRVQSPVLRWVCEREREIKNFVPSPYFVLDGRFNRKNSDYELKASYSLENKIAHTGEKEMVEVLKSLNVDLRKEKYFPPKIGNSHEVKINRKEFTLNKFIKRLKKDFPPPPHTTSSLQKEASLTLKFPPSKTMRLAQKLYEGDGNGGLITYHRTDSVRVSPKGSQMASEYLKNFPDLKANPYFRRKLKSNVQDAHEAIRPTKLGDKRVSGLSPDEKKLYDLIFNRFIISFLSPVEKVVANGCLSDGMHEFIFTMEEITEQGYLKYGGYIPSKRVIPDFQVGEKFILDSIQIHSRETQPPPRYKESSLVDKMEKTGIGRPSTYATTLDVLGKRGYIRFERTEVIPTDLGFLVNDEIVHLFGNLIQDKFTSEMEISLDKIASGKLAKEDFLKEFYTANMSLKKETSNPRTTGKICPLCREGYLKKKLSREKKTYFLCSRFPHCEFAEYSSGDKS